MKHFLPAFFLAVLLSQLKAQTGIFYGMPVEQKSTTVFNEFFANCQLFDLETLQLEGYLKDKNYAGVIRLMVGEKYDWIIELWAHDMRGPDYKMRVAGPYGIQEFSDRPVITYRGKVQGKKGGEVRLTLKQDFIYGYITYDGEEFFIEPARRYDKHAPSERFVLYSESEVLKGKDLPDCGVQSDDVNKLHFDGQKPGSGEDLSKAGVCKEVELACAADHLMFDKLGGNAEDVEAYAMGVINNVEGDYAASFADNITFVFVEFFISTSSANDPVSTSITDASTVLCDFKNWGNAGGFTAGFDLGELWTDRDFDGTTIGIAYVGAICLSGTASGCTGSGSLGYHAFQDNKSTNACNIRVLASHEIGHNFGASHDGTGGYIMSPSVSCTSTWSSASVMSVNANLGRSCLEACTTVYGPPIADFGVNTTLGCKSIAFDFDDLSTNDPDSWAWTFTGGTPATATSQAPPVSYATNGSYAVSLTATNTLGSDAVTKNSFVEVTDAPVATTTPDDGSSGSLGILGVRLNDMLHFTGSAAVEGTYEDFSCAAIARLEPSTSYDFYATVGDCNASLYEGVRLWIDYNGDGDFLDAGEDLGSTSPSAYCGEISPINFTTPSSPVTNAILRLRVISELLAIPSGPNMDPVDGQVEDYGVYYASVLPVELAVFNAGQEGQNVRVYWQTASETGNEYFTLERSFDGIRFWPLAKIDGAGNATSGKLYEYLDTEPVPGVNYYRLRQTNFDGHETVSDIVSVEIGNGTSRLTVYPNPVGGQVLYLEIILDKQEEVRVDIFHSSGWLTHSFMTPLQSGLNRLKVDAEHLPAGVFFLKVVQNGWVQSARFIKK